MMLRPLLTLALVGTLLATPALAQDTRTTVRAELTALFSQAKVPFIVGPDIDGELTLSVGSVPLAQKVRLIISTLPHKVEYKVENGIHIVRRLPGKLPASASYVDALKLEIASLKAERAAMTVPHATEIDRARLEGIDRKILVLTQLLSREKPAAARS